MAFSWKVLERDLGWAKILLTAKSLSKGKSYVKVGLLGGSKNPRPGEPITNVELGLIQEFGTSDGRIPARSFIRAPFHAKRAEYLRMLRLLLKATLSRETFGLPKALAIMGERIAADFKATGPGTPPPNAPSTLRRKLAKTRPGSVGDPRTLVDTGRLMNSITYAIVIAGAGEKKE